MANRLDFACACHFAVHSSCNGADQTWTNSIECRNEVVQQLGRIDDMAQHIQTMIPAPVLSDIDSGRNPMHLTKDRLERAATENQFMNGRIHAIEVRAFPVLF